jgi:hypothetical protein
VNRRSACFHRTARIALAQHQWSEFEKFVQRDTMRTERRPDDLKRFFPPSCAVKALVKGKPHVMSAAGKYHTLPQMVLSFMKALRFEINGAQFCLSHGIIWRWLDRGLGKCDGLTQTAGKSMGGSEACSGLERAGMNIECPGQVADGGSTSSHAPGDDVYQHKRLCQVWAVLEDLPTDTLQGWQVALRHREHCFVEATRKVW